LKIKHLLYEKKFTIQGAKQHLKAKSAARKEKIEKVTLNEIRSELESIRTLIS
jgi:hypothetical protein